jgi:hypothetical protein
MASATDPTFNIAGLQISEDFPSGFLQSGSPIANDINSFSHAHSLLDLLNDVVHTYHDILKSDLTIRVADTNLLTGNPGFSAVLTEGQNLIGTIGVSALPGTDTHLAGLLPDLLSLVRF